MESEENKEQLQGHKGDNDDVEMVNDDHSDLEQKNNLQKQIESLENNDDTNLLVESVYFNPSDQLNDQRQLNFENNQLESQVIQEEVVEQQPILPPPDESIVASPQIDSNVEDTSAFKSLLEDRPSLVLPQSEEIPVKSDQSLIRIEKMPEDVYVYDMEDLRELDLTYKIQNLKLDTFLTVGNAAHTEDLVIFKQEEQDFTRLISELKEEGFTHWRSVVGDGNCYWRCVSFAYLEQLVVNSNEKALNNLLFWVQNESHYFDLSNEFPDDLDLVKDKLKNTLCTGLHLLLQVVRNCPSKEEKFQFLQRFYVCNMEFDKCFIYLIRKMTKNFILQHREKTLHGLQLEQAPLVEENEDNTSLEGYFENIVMKMNRDAQGILLMIVPIILRINVSIININSEALTKDSTAKTFYIVQCNAQADDLKLEINDNLNFHDSMHIYVVIKDGHYDILYRGNHSFDHLEQLASHDHLFNNQVTFIRERQVSLMQNRLNKQEEVKQEGGANNGIMKDLYRGFKKALFTIIGFNKDKSPKDCFKKTDQVYMTCCFSYVSLQDIFEGSNIKNMDSDGFPNDMKCPECKCSIKPSDMTKIHVYLKEYKKSIKQQKNQKREVILPTTCMKCMYDINEKHTLYQLACECCYHIKCLNDIPYYHKKRPCNLYGCTNMTEISEAEFKDIRTQYYARKPVW